MSRFSIPPFSPLYIVLLGLLSALPPLGIDAGLPAIPGLQSDFGISGAQAAQTLTVFLVGFSIGPLLFGPVADRFGRRPVLIGGVAVFSLAALGCALARSLESLLVFRLVQGIGAGAAAALPAAIVRDVFRGDDGITRQSYVALVNAVAPLVAPLLGAGILLVGDWRSINAVLAALGVLVLAATALGYRETAPRFVSDGEETGIFRAAMKGYRDVMRDRTYMIGTALVGLTFGTMFAYIAGSASVFMGLLGTTSTTYGFLFAATAAGTIAGAAVNGRLASRCGAGRLLRIGVSGNVTVTALLVIAAQSDMCSIIATTSLVVASNFCAGIVMPNATHHALSTVGRVAGSAASLLRAVQMVVGAVAGASLALFSDDPFLAMSGVMAGCALMAVIVLVVGHENVRHAADVPA